MPTCWSTPAPRAAASPARAAETGLPLRALIRDHLAAAQAVRPLPEPGPLLAAVEQAVDAFVERYFGMRLSQSHGVAVATGPEPYGDGYPALANGKIDITG